MAQGRNVKVFSFQGFDSKHYQTTEQYVSIVKELYDRALKEIISIASKADYNPNKPFSFADYPKTYARIQKIIAELSDNIRVTINNGSEREWLFACKKNEAFLQSIIDVSKLSKLQLSQYQNRRLDALKSFQERKVNGMNLSERIWKYTEQYKQHIEDALDVGIGEGRSAAQISRDVRQNLQDPDKLFRRVRDKRGNLHLSKRAKAYKPGVGKYRSSYKNAMRLTRSEINMAYRQSDWLRWQSLDFVVGYEIKRSNREPKCKCSLCERLKGKYPKAFKFVGWHPQCLCYAIPIMEDFNSEDRRNRLRAALYGTEYKKYVSPNTITDVPDEFKAWVEENKDRQAGWASTPYFIRDNFKNGNLSEGLRFGTTTARIIKTEEQKADIQRRWNIRRSRIKYNKIVSNIAKEYGEVASISAYIDKVKAEIAKGVSPESIGIMVDKLNHKVGIKQAWDERIENNRLSMLLVDVPKIKAAFGVEAIKEVFKAVEKKLASWENLPLEKQKEKLLFEVDWVEKHKKYSTWEVARDAYKKSLLAINYQIAKNTVEENIGQSLIFAKTTKSVKVKHLADEISIMLSKNSPIEQLNAKAEILNKEVSRLEAKRVYNLNKNKKNIFDEGNYSQERKNKAIWCKSERESITKLKGTADIVYKGSSTEERDAVYEYTKGSGHINRPLRGYDWSWSNFKGIGKVPLNNEHPVAEKRIELIEKMIARSSYNVDIWLQRGISSNGLCSFLGIKNISNLKNCLGKVVTDTAFMSCGAAKNTGFGGYILNIYCPKGTKMLYIDGRSHYKSENEMLIQRNTTFRVTKINNYFIDIEVIAQ